MPGPPRIEQNGARQADGVGVASRDDRFGLL
jgi:hypothetical protein